MLDRREEKSLPHGDLIGQMTLEEKASLMSGANFWNTKAIERLGIPSIMLTDGPHGLRKQGGKADHLGLNKSIPSTCFPTAATLANSWDIALLAEVGSYLGKEAASEDVGILLGPGLNIKRNPLCGRNFEYFSEDPYLSGTLAAAMVQGIQKEGISACPKHYAVNSQETHRMSIDEIVDERALQEIYLEGFRLAIAEGKAKTIMTSYNKVNGEFANENTYLLQEVLQKQWSYDGLIVTDWGGNNDRVAGLLAGNGLEMPSTNGMTDRDILQAVKDGRVSEALLDQRVSTLLSLINQVIPALGTGKRYTLEEHHQQATLAATRSMVLLKNEDTILPLDNPSSRIAVIGDFAKHPRYQGAGSSLINPTVLDNALDALQTSKCNIIGYEQGFHRLGRPSSRLLHQAVKLAGESDIVLLFLGLDEGSEAEGVDRQTMSLPKNQLQLVKALLDTHAKIVLILSGGSPVELPFAAKLSAILHAYLPGQGGGTAIAKVLLGEYNPSGKLAETYPLSYQDVPNSRYFPGQEATAEHRESIYIGYRYYDTTQTPVLFPFGFGLSYTSFAYRQLEASITSVRLWVKNTGQRSGEEVVQIYVKPLASQVFRAEKELKGFAKVWLEPGEEKHLEIPLPSNSFSYYHVGQRTWVIEPGEYEILAAASSRDIRLSSKVTVEGLAEVSPYRQDILPHYFSGAVRNVTETEFSQLLGRPLPPPLWQKGQPLGYRSLLVQGKNAGFFGRLLYRLLRLVYHIYRWRGKPIIANNVLFVSELPYISLARMSGGRVNMEMLDGLLLMVNGSFWRGLSAYLKAARRKKKYSQEK